MWYYWSSCDSISSLVYDNIEARWDWKYPHELFKWIHLRWTVTFTCNVVNPANHSLAPRTHHAIQLQRGLLTLPGPTMTNNTAVRRIHLVTLAEPCAQTEYFFCQCHVVLCRSNLLFSTNFRSIFLFRIAIYEFYHFTSLMFAMQSVISLKPSDKSHLPLTEVTRRPLLLSFFMPTTVIMTSLVFPPAPYMLRHLLWDLSSLARVIVSLTVLQYRLKRENI